MTDNKSTNTVWCFFNDYVKIGVMKQMKKLAVTLACFFVVMFVMVGCTPSAPTPKPEEPVINSKGAIKNVILMIGDGFGPNHLANAKKYFGVDKFAFEDDYVCDVTTYSKNSEVTDGYTDSAAAATAMATGQKVNNGEVGYHNSQEIKNIMEYAMENKMKTGVITSDTLLGATPAGFSAHTSSRGNATVIYDDQVNSGIDLFVGAYATEYSNWLQLLNQGYLQRKNKPDAIKNLNSNDKCFALYTSLKPQRNHLNEYPGEAWVDYPALIKDSLNFLDNENGFCCMIEGANIDKYSHGNDFVSAMYEVLYFAEMIEAVYEFVAGRDDTLVLITADHETGGLQLGNTQDELNDSLYTTGNHTATDVNLFVNFPATCQLSNYKDKIDNTDIFKICYQIVTGGKFDANLICA